MVPLDLASGDAEDVDGVNVVNVNPAHQLFAFGIEGNGTVQFWDPRSRSRVGLLHLPTSTLTPNGMDTAMDLSVTAIASRSDGLSYAIGTSTGHTLLYDIRSPRPYASKDQGYGLPVKCVEWVEGGSRVAGEGLVISADKKVVKIWDRNSVSVLDNFVVSISHGFRPIQTSHRSRLLQILITYTIFLALAFSCLRMKVYI